MSRCQVQHYLQQLNWQRKTSNIITQQMRTFKTIFQLCLSTSRKNPMKRPTSTQQMLTNQQMTCTALELELLMLKRGLLLVPGLPSVLDLNCRGHGKTRADNTSNWIQQLNPSWTQSEDKPKYTRMWANAQRDGRPAEYRWRPQFNATKFGCRPLLECRAVTLPRRQTRWNLRGCPKLTKQSQPLVGRSSPYYGHM